MPELPEVETIVRRMREPLIGKKIFAVEVLKEKSFIGNQQDIEAAEISAIQRQAKIIDISLDSGLHVLVHLKMTGQLIYTDGSTRLGGGHPTADWVSELPSKHTRVVIRLSSGTLYFNDMRIFGWMKVVTPDQRRAEFASYAPDINTPAISPEYLQTRFANKKVAVKTAVLDSNIVSGVGNIYANDALHLARIHPLRPVCSLSTDEIHRLTAALKEVIHLGIELGGATIDHFRDINGFAGQYQTKVRVYGKEGEPCSECGTPIQKMKVGGRGTFLCPQCQLER